MVDEPVALSEDEKANCMAALAQAAFMPLPKYELGLVAPLEMELEWEPPQRPLELTDEDKRQIAEAFAAMDRRFAFWRDHYQELACQYPEQFLAVKDGKPIANDSDLYTLVDKLHDLGMDPQETYIEFMSTKPRMLVL